MDRPRSSVIAVFELSSRFLETTLQDLPAMTVAVVQEVSLDSETAFLDFWASGDDFETFERALEAYEPVTATHLTDVIGGRKLYRVQFKPSRATYVKWVEVGAVLLDGTGTQEGWAIRMQFPSRDAFAEYTRYCQENGYSLTIRKLFETSAPKSECNLTDRQYEILSVAVEDGFFDIPRRTTLDDIASKFDISSQAVSERIRRGLSTVLLETVFDSERSVEPLD